MFKHHAHEEKCHCNSACGGSVYFVGFIGAAIYYIQTATSFWGGALGILKAIVWPAFLVYKLLGFLG
ncbi:hypothetical protein M0R72_09875 [Candidatus Pacearchaeota archaeon]|nr:hypothetical protein [Candidatus Pacearchaeota archaeon]